MDERLRHVASQASRILDKPVDHHPATNTVFLDSIPNLLLRTSLDGSLGDLSGTSLVGLDTVK